MDIVTGITPSYIPDLHRQVIQLLFILNILLLVFLPWVGVAFLFCACLYLLFAVGQQHSIYTRSLRIHAGISEWSVLLLISMCLAYLAKPNAYLLNFIVIYILILLVTSATTRQVTTPWVEELD